ncbi:uncharacterized protein LOC108950841 [Ciona intestinalis]
MKFALYVICCYVFITSCIASSHRNEKRVREIIQISERMNYTVDPANLTPAQIRLLFKMNSFCQCECCRESPAPQCDRENPVDVGENFTCPENFCTGEAMCRNYDQSECEKSCFCQRCGSSLPDDDYRCRSNVTYMSPSCNCSSLTHLAPCAEEEFDPHQVAWQLQLMLTRKRLLECTLACFCVDCDVATLSQVIQGGPPLSNTCDGIMVIPDYCRECAPCPTAESLRLAQQHLNLIRISQASYSKK